MGGTRSLPVKTARHLLRTCLAWTADGELSADDRGLVLELLGAAEPPGANPMAKPTASATTAPAVNSTAAPAASLTASANASPDARPAAGMLEGLSSAAPAEARCRLPHPGPS